jgi:hypothetical protein
MPLLTGDPRGSKASRRTGCRSRRHHKGYEVFRKKEDGAIKVLP